ncbi:predicted protein [Naegleria gruberi]|uniref:Predicted protein n=1 Tax=Naegleria gruberi TaxID=5762 RepID=D2W3D7_NAEGR|nr:uncharacterized protein NAEGRDRAFT_75909 [Naegleria gruberi]EFC36399.1 predicted protein [Naegleria gruberi]|eukprot:XP_002669143.1 predicted protein [Naegleria gruberi strain NEG-M]
MLPQEFCKIPIHGENSHMVLSLIIVSDTEAKLALSAQDSPAFFHSASITGSIFKNSLEEAREIISVGSAGKLVVMRQNHEMVNLCKKEDQECKITFFKQNESIQNAMEYVVRNLTKPYLNSDWILIMKCAGTDMGYDSIHWTTGSTLNSDKRNDLFEGLSAKYPEFNLMQVNELLLVTPNGQAHLVLKEAKTMLERFQSNKTEIAHLRKGQDPLSLASGFEMANFMVPKSPYWKINAYSNKYPETFKARIGGFFSYQWNSSDYGVDTLNFPGSAEIAGIGITDKVFNPFCPARSFGVRQAHDSDSLPSGGQTSGEVHIYARLVNQ